MTTCNECNESYREDMYRKCPFCEVRHLMTQTPAEGCIDRENARFVSVNFYDEDYREITLAVVPDYSCSCGEIDHYDAQVEYRGVKINVEINVDPRRSATMPGEHTTI